MNLYEAVPQVMISLVPGTKKVCRKAIYFSEDITELKHYTIGLTFGQAQETKRQETRRDKGL